MRSAGKQTAEELIDRYLGARETLAEAVAAHPEARSGSWSGREVLMHVIGWDRYAVEWVPRLAAGEPEEPCDEDEANDRYVRDRATLSDEALAAEYEAAGEAFAAMLRSLPDSAFEEGAAGRTWGEGYADHALEHAAVFGDIGS